MEPHEFSELEKVEATDGAGEASTLRPASGDLDLLQMCIHPMPLCVLYCWLPMPSKGFASPCCSNYIIPQGEAQHVFGSGCWAFPAFSKVLPEVFKLPCRKVHAPEVDVDNAVTVVTSVSNLQRSLSQLSCWALAS